MQKNENYAHILAIDDAPFVRESQQEVLIVGTVYANHRLDGVVSAKITQDGDDAAHVIAQMVRNCKFAPQLHLVFFQGIALGGFNVIDIHALHEELGIPVLVVARKEPNLDAIERALLTHVQNGAAKWALIEKAGRMEPAADVFVQRAGISLADAAAVIQKFAIHGRIPEPLRVAHLIAGGVTTGESRGRS